LAGSIVGVEQKFNKAEFQQNVHKNYVKKKQIFVDITSVKIYIPMF
jgi:hypothetical protein